MKAIPSTAIRIPSTSALYIFGSALTSPNPNDLDVLVVYNPVECSSQEAYQLHRETIEDLVQLYGLPVHITLLTPSEESNVSFIQRTGAVPVSVAQKVLILRSNRPPSKVVELKR